jgi:hypothetical protein
VKTGFALGHSIGKTRKITLWRSLKTTEKANNVTNQSICEVDLTKSGTNAASPG